MLRGAQHHRSATITALLRRGGGLGLCASTVSHAEKSRHPCSSSRSLTPLLRRGDTLTDTDRARLDKLFDAHPRLKAGWHALQELHGLYTADDYDGALEALGRFCDLYENGELPEYHDTVDTFIAWSDEILNWHHTGRPSNGSQPSTGSALRHIHTSNRRACVAAVLSATAVAGHTGCHVRPQSVTAWRRSCRRSVVRCALATYKPIGSRLC